MAQKTIDNVGVLITPKSMMGAIDDNFDELYATKSSVWGYISVPAATTITTAGTYYPIEGTFVNEVVDFSAATVVIPGIKYDGVETRMFKVDLTAQVEAGLPNTIVTLAITKNGTLVPGSPIPVSCRVAGSPYSLPATVVVELAQNDEVQLVCTSDGSGDEIVFDNLQTTIRPFN